jgi:hypothetical protein
MEPATSSIGWPWDLAPGEAEAFRDLKDVVAAAGLVLLRRQRCDLAPVSVSEISSLPKGWTVKISL